MSNHTPGPWRVEHSTAKGYLYMSYLYSDEHHIISVGGSSISKGENKANARLIAAAPDLLAACEAVWQSCDREGRIMLPSNGTTITALRAAIAKAKGTTP